jgi:hypothetical protein
MFKRKFSFKLQYGKIIYNIISKLILTYLYLMIKLILEKMHFNFININIFAVNSILIFSYSLF